MHHQQIEHFHEPQPYILVVDDDIDDLEMLSFELKMKGIKVKTFESPTKALLYLTLMSGNNELPSLIILDYNMPQRNGRQVLLSIKDNNDTKEIPVIIYSTGMCAILKTKLLAAGALDCIDKPWNSKELNVNIELFQKLAFPYKSDKKLA
ncbi:MAG: two-component system response regulator [Flavisolibacter sp.]